jgi:hypothetical protein
MRQAVLDRLRSKHVTLTPQQVTAGTRLLDQQLAYEVDAYLFGRAAQLRRRTEDDPQVHAALGLFQNGATQAALLAQVAGGPSIQ